MSCFAGLLLSISILWKNDRRNDFAKLDDKSVQATASRPYVSNKDTVVDVYDCELCYSLDERNDLLGASLASLFAASAPCILSMTLHVFDVLMIASQNRTWQPFLKRHEVSRSSRSASLFRRQGHICCADSYLLMSCTQKEMKRSISRLLLHTGNFKTL